MRLLLDTHALAWWARGDTALNQQVRAAIGNNDNDVFVSAVSIYEASLKHKLGKWPEASILLVDVQGYLESQQFLTLPLGIQHAERAGALPLKHRDPFDRMLIAQALTENLTLISNEELFDQFGVRRLW